MAAASAAAWKVLGFGRTTFQGGLRFGNPPRTRLRATNPDPRLGDDAIGEPVCHQRHRDCKIAGAPIEFMETEAGLVGNDRQANFGEDLVFRQRRRHDAFEKIVCRDDALPALAGRDHFAESVAATRHHSDAGSACAMLPQNVPRVRIG